MMIPNPVDDHVQETAVCTVTVKVWLPFLTTGDEMDVSMNNDCAITKGPIKSIDMCTTAISFMLDDINFLFKSIAG